MKRQPILLSLVAVFVLGCSSSIETNGQVFIDTSGAATKVAQAEIYVLSEEVLVSNLKASVSAMRAEHDRLQAAHRSNSEYLAKTVALAQQAQGLAMASSISMAGPSAWPGANAQLASSTNSMMETASKSLLNAKKQFQESEAALTGLANGSNADFFLPKAIQGASVAATSDADGKFKLSLEVGKRVAIIGKKDKYAWLIWATPKKGDQIFLTDKNLNGTQCDTCVFSKAELNSTLAFIPAAFA